MFIISPFVRFLLNGINTNYENFKILSNETKHMIYMYLLSVVDTDTVVVSSVVSVWVRVVVVTVVASGVSVVDTCSKLKFILQGNCDTYTVHQVTEKKIGMGALDDSVFLCEQMFTAFMVDFSVL